MTAGSSEVAPNRARLACVCKEITTPVAAPASATKGSDYVVPLRVWADTPYGLVAVVANSLKIDGQIPKAD